MLDSAAKDSSDVKAPVQLDEVLWPLTRKDSCFSQVCIGDLRSD